MPCGWNVVKNRNIFFEKKETVGDHYKDYELLSLTLRGIVPRDVESGKGKFPKDFDTYKIVIPGDLVFCLFDMDETPRTVGISDQEGMVTGAYTVLGVHDANPRYLYYYYLALDNRKALRYFYTGLRKTIDINTFLNMKVILPPIEEQEAIVRFLDDQTRKIDELIELRGRKTKDLFDLLQLFVFSDEGDVSEIGSFDRAFPEEWSTMKARYIFHERSQKGFLDKELLAVTQDKGVIKKMESEKNYLVTEDVASQKLVLDGDYLISLRSFQGGIETSYLEGLVSAAYSVFYLDEKYTKYREYFSLLFKSKPFIAYLNSLVKDVRDGKKIGFDDFCECIFALPPEQTLYKIHEYKEQFDREKEYKDQSIRLLEEYKARIIQNAVVGGLV